MNEKTKEFLDNFADFLLTFYEKELSECTTKTEN